MLPKNLYNEIKKMIFQFTSSQRTEITALQTAVATLENEWLETTVSLTSANILALGTTPYQLLAAPGAGKYYEISKLTFEYKHITTAYTLADPYLTVTGGYNGNIEKSIITTSVNNVAKAAGNYVSTDGAINYGLNPSMNAQVLLTTSAATDPTLGLGTMKVKITYKIVTFTV